MHWLFRHVSDLPELIQEHRDLYGAIASGDPDRAAAQSASHIGKYREQFPRTSFRKQNPLFTGRKNEIACHQPQHQRRRHCADRAEGPALRLAGHRAGGPHRRARRRIHRNPFRVPDRRRRGGRDHRRIPPEASDGGTAGDAYDGGTARADRIDAAPFDCVVVAAFGDPGMPALKELVDVPVIGITEAALCAAALQGHRFSIIAISDRIRPWYLDCVERFGLGGRLASIRSINESLNGIGSVQQDFKETLLALSRQAVTEDGADVVILAGAPARRAGPRACGADPRSGGGRHLRRHPHDGSGRRHFSPARTGPARSHRRRSRHRKGLSENLDAALAAAQSARRRVPAELGGQSMSHLPDLVIAHGTVVNSFGRRQRPRGGAMTAESSSSSMPRSPSLPPPAPSTPPAGW